MTSDARRTCIGCRAARSPGEMIRLVVGPDGWSVGRHAPGRGASLCAGSIEACFDAAQRRGAFSRAARRRVSAAEVERLRLLLSGPS